MSRVRINSLRNIMSITQAAYVNIDADVELPVESPGRPRYFSYSDIEHALEDAFDKVIFDKCNILGEYFLFNKIIKVIYNGPATIILWDDGTKTVVKCKEGDPYSPEAGFALAVLKRLTGNNFHRCLREAMKGAVKDNHADALIAER